MLEAINQNIITFEDFSNNLDSNLEDESEPSQYN